MHPGHHGQLLLLDIDSDREKNQDLEKRLDHGSRRRSVSRPHLHLVLLHVDAGVGVGRSVDRPHERVGDGGLGQVRVVGAVVVRHQAAQAGCRDVPREGATVLFLIARVARGGRDRQREVEQEEERERPGMKHPSSRKCAAARAKGV